MPDDNPQEGRRLQVVAAAANEPEADLILQRLAQAGINATSQRTIGSAEWGTSGSHYIYVEAAEHDRAREILKTTQGISEEELAKLSEQPLPGGEPTEQGPSGDDGQN